MRYKALEIISVFLIIVLICEGAFAPHSAVAEYLRPLATKEKKVSEPIIDNSPDPELLKRWIADLPPLLKFLGSFIVGHITYITHQEFKAALRRTLVDFSKKQKGKSFPYLIILPDQASDRWVTDLALEMKLLQADTSTIRNLT
jgi:hypothetical protein